MQGLRALHRLFLWAFYNSPEQIMPSIVFMSGDSSKEVSLDNVNSVEDVASNMKEVIEADKTKKEVKTNDWKGIIPGLWA